MEGRVKKYVLWATWIADLIECVNQGILVVGHEHNVEVDGGARWRVSDCLPV